MSKPLALVVEDDPQLGPIFSLALQPEFATDLITDGQAALDRLAQVAPVLVVLDVNLPKVSGCDIMEHIRSEARLAKTKIIIVTEDSNQCSTLAGEADIVLLKPISPLQLRELASRLRAA